MKNRNGIWSNHFFHPVVSKKATLHTLQAGEKTWTGLVGCNKKTSQLSLWVPQL